VEHEKTCGYAIVTCKYSLRCEGIRRKNLQKHELSCQYRPMQCSHCQTAVEYSRMEAHLKVCDKVSVLCTRCNEETLRGELEKHKLNSCLEEEVMCQFFDQGCQVVTKRKNLKHHLSEETAGHLVLLKKSFEDQIDFLKQNYDSQLKARDTKIKNLERILGETETKIEWRVKNWSSVKSKNYIQSDKFRVSDFNWFLGFYPNGDNEDSKGFLSIYLFLDPSGIPKGKNVNIEFMLGFLNHKDACETVKKDFKTTFPIEGGQGWGDRKAIRSSKIHEEGGFLKLDTLHIEAQLLIKKVTWVL